jgi:methylated-DNA-[protein]-cysteine S-methyltransferase
MDFKNKVFSVCKKIPKGKITTYKEIAIDIKNNNSSRAIGNALNKNTNLIKIPCHRVIRSNGEIGGYAKGQKEKIKLLKSEGIEIKNNKINLEKYLFKF